MSNFLITYHFQRLNKDHGRFIYKVVKSVTEWIDYVQQFEDGEYVLINVLPITEEEAQRYDGSLKSM
jgi:hypothetical protein